MVRVVFLVLLLCPGVVSATDTQVQVLVGDVCPNIAGNQPTLPGGMQHDQNGDCYTPAPPPPPDACSNLTGHQTAVPAGYYRNQSGNCIAQTRPPRDVCPNITDTQAEMPYGMQTTENGDCVWPLHDVCPNILGPQEQMPEKMTYNKSNECYTPTPVTTPTTEKPTTPTSSTAVFDPLPYYIIAGWAFVTLLLLFQTFRESFVTREIIALYWRKRSEGEAKDQLIVLLMQYLKKALDAMINNLPSTTTAKEDEEIMPLMATTRQLQTNIATTDTTELGDSPDDPDAFSRAGIHVKTLLSPLFLISTVLVVGAVIIANTLLGPSAPIAFGMHHLWLQAGLLFFTALFLFLVLRSRHMRHIQHQHIERLVKDTVTLNTAKEDFLHRIHIVLDVGLHDIAPYRQQMSNDTTSETFRKHYDQLVNINNSLAAFYTKDSTTQSDTDSETNTYVTLKKTVASYLDANPRSDETTGA